MDIIRLYRSLPADLQRHVTRFVPVWERFGLRRPQIFAPKNGHASYFSKIRRSPHGARRDPEHSNVLFYRIQQHMFQFSLYVRSNNANEDYWVITITPQFKDVSIGTPQWWLMMVQMQRMNAPPAQASLVVSTMTQTGSAWSLVFSVHRENETMPPTRQTMAQEFIGYVRRLSPAMHRYGRMKRIIS